ncbi:MAG: cytochrome P460 [Thiotrichaceae bacterium]|nr:MAG: cytochrome P460 [Thiotrichaceae bacterium]
MVFMGVSFSLYASNNSGDKSHGISYPTGWKNWSSIAVSHRVDNHTLRLILGNQIAVKAARSGNTNPWPKGSVLAKVVWKESKKSSWYSAIVPDEFIHAEFMFKDASKYSDTYGWGWARWVGGKQIPFNAGSNICSDCHSPVKEKDWVFTVPAVFPKNYAVVPSLV